MKQEEKKPQEFWIDVEINKPTIYVTNVWKTHCLEAVHVIEYTAYEDLKAELDKCKIDQIEFLTEHPTYKLSKELEAENEQLKAKLEKACEALRFYSDVNNWGNIGRPNYDILKGFDFDNCGVADQFNSWKAAGAKARAALKEIEGD